MVQALALAKRLRSVTAPRASGLSTETTAMTVCTQTIDVAFGLDFGPSFVRADRAGQQTDEARIGESRWRDVGAHLWPGWRRVVVGHLPFAGRSGPRAQPGSARPRYQRALRRQPGPQMAPPTWVGQQERVQGVSGARMDLARSPASTVQAADAYRNDAARGGRGYPRALQELSDIHEGAA